MTETTPELPPIEEQPLVTFALFAYNQEKYIREAVEGAFAQTYEPLEIILSDDCSTDRTFEIMKEMVAEYRGPHHVVVRKNPRNFGVAKHYFEVLNASIGDIVVLAAGDDISGPDRAFETAKILHRDMTVAFVEVEELQFSGSESPKLPRKCSRNNPVYRKFELNEYLLDSSPSLTGALRTIRRKYILQFGSFIPNCPTEDTPSILRLLLRGRGVKITSTHVLRRIHDLNLSSAESMRRMNHRIILKQYLHDIREGELQGIISLESGAKMRDYLENKIARRELTILMENKKWELIRYALICNLPKVEKILWILRFMKKSWV